MKSSMILGLVFTALVSLSANAADNSKAFYAMMNLASGLVANGDVSKVSKYDAAKFDEYEEQRAAIVDFLDQGGCANGGIKPRADHKNNLKLLKRVTADANGEITPASDAGKFLKIVNDLEKNQQLKGMLSVSWDEKEEAGESAEGVSCSVYLFRFFSVDGYRLTVVFSNTD